MTKKTNAEAPPKSLGKPGCEFWQSVTEQFHILPHHRPLLEQACRCLDRAEEIRGQIESEGLTIRSAKGEVRPHPLLVAERDIRRTYGYLLRVLGLSDQEKPQKPPKPTRAL